MGIAKAGGGDDPVDARVQPCPGMAACAVVRMDGLRRSKTGGTCSSGRSLGVLLIGAQQAASAVAPALPRNAARKWRGEWMPPSRRRTAPDPGACASARSAPMPGTHGGGDGCAARGAICPCSPPTPVPRSGRGRSAGRCSGPRTDLPAHHRRYRGSGAEVSMARTMICNPRQAFGLHSYGGISGITESL